MPRLLPQRQAGRSHNLKKATQTPLEPALFSYLVLPFSFRAQSFICSGGKIPWTDAHPDDILFLRRKRKNSFTLIHHLLIKGGIPL